MSKVQTRRSVSVRGVTYRRLREHCTQIAHGRQAVVEDQRLRPATQPQVVENRAALGERVGPHGHARAKPGGAATDNEDIGRYLPLHYYLTILSTAGSIISVLNAAAVQQAKSIFL